MRLMGTASATYGPTGASMDTVSSHIEAWTANVVIKIWIHRLGCLALMLASLVAPVQAASSKPSKRRSSRSAVRKQKPPDFNRDIFYRNKLELSYEVGWLPINVPLVFDFLTDSPYTTWPLHYTLVPMIVSLRWQLDGIQGPSVVRGNTDFTFSGSFTAIPRGPETRYPAFDFGIRQNFIQPNWRVVPYFEMRGGIGNIDAKGPDGVLYAQGQDLTFTYMMGSGIRYDFNPRYSIEFGANYMHVSNAYLSQPKYEDFGINVWGPMVGFNMRIGKAKQPSAQ